MGVSDICDHRHIGLRDADQIIDLAEVVHAHLKHRDLVLCSETKYRHRKAEVIVKVSCGLKGAEFGREDRGNHILGSSLAYASRDRHHRKPEFAAVVRQC